MWDVTGAGLVWERDRGHALGVAHMQENHHMDENIVWQRVVQHAGHTFHTCTGLPFTYQVIGATRGPIRVVRDGHEIDRNISRASFEKALPSVPCDRPSDISQTGVVGRSYVWAILNDPRIS